MRRFFYSAAMVGSGLLILAFCSVGLWAVFWLALAVAALQ